MKNNRGFSLIELIVVIAIMTILAGMIIGYTGGWVPEESTNVHPLWMEQ